MTNTATDHTSNDTAGNFTICDESSANWLLRKLGNIAAEQARVKAQATEILHGLESDASGLLYLYERQLQDYIRLQLEAKHGRSRTLRLIQGTCSFRTVPEHLRVQNPSEAIRYADSAGLPCIVVRRELDSRAYLRDAEAALQATGEILPGMEIVEERESFSIRFGGTKETETGSPSYREPCSEPGEVGETRTPVVSDP